VKKRILLLGLIMIVNSVSAMSLFRSRRPEPEPDPVPPVQIPSDPPAQTPDPTPSPINFIEVADQVGKSVDSYFGNYQALDTRRVDSLEHESDYCEIELEEHQKFSERVSYFVELQLEDTKTHLAYLAPYYAVPRDNDDFHLSGLAQRPLCHSTSSSLRKTLKKSDRVPGSSVISKMNTFEEKVNSLRTQMIAGSDEAKMELSKIWSRFFSCLAYTESLSTADSSSSQKVAKKYAPSGYRKPAGVKFYEDPYQDEASKLNIGMYQFTPKGSGNINACLKSWNDRYPSCQVATGSSRSELVRVFGSSLQTMNAFCGVNKIVQTFSVQLNSTKSSAIHPSNSGRSKSDRCVTPFIYSGYAYNHFGPLMNSTRSNLSKLMTCVMK